MGCGTGVVGKYLIEDDYVYTSYRRTMIMTDIDPMMLQLARINNSSKSEWIKFKQYDILGKSEVSEMLDLESLVITHGVLEHFSEEQIKTIMSNLSNSYDQIHYVPTDGYKTKSFGDENLWSVQKWIDLINPDIYLVNQADLFMIKSMDPDFRL